MECTAYHPVRRQWIPLVIPGLSEMVWDDARHNIQIYVEQIKQRPYLIIFKESLGRADAPLYTECWTYPLSIPHLQRLLNRVASAPTFSLLELERANAFLEAIATGWPKH